MACKTFYKIYPDINSIEEKAWKFLETYYNYGCSINALSKLLDINYRTTSKIFEDIKKMSIYDRFIDKKYEGVKGFDDPKYFIKTFDRFEDELYSIEKKIEEAEINNNDSLSLKYRRLKQSLMKDQLKACLMLKRNPDNNINTTEMDEVDLQIEELKKEAVKEFHIDKMQ